MSYKKVIGSLAGIITAGVISYGISKPHETQRTTQDNYSTIETFIENLNNGNIPSVSSDSFNHLRQRNPTRAAEQSSKLKFPYSSKQPHITNRLNSSNYKNNQNILETLEDSFEDHESLYCGGLGTLLGLLAISPFFKKRKK